MEKNRLLQNNDLLSAKVVEVVGEREVAELSVKELESKLNSSEQLRSRSEEDLSQLRLAAKECKEAANEMVKNFEVQEKAYKELAIAKDSLAALYSSNVLVERETKEKAQSALENLKKSVEADKEKMLPRMQKILGYHVALSVERLHERGFIVPRDVMNCLNDFDEASVKKAVAFL
ncbi:hypothetical protein M5689_011282 [Euphorbia peplus]|nr:hypothetical protein M5689_011282 [Euphorbia peplus]